MECVEESEWAMVDGYVFVFVFVFANFLYTVYRIYLNLQSFFLSFSEPFRFLFFSFLFIFFSFHFQFIFILFAVNSLI